MYNPQTAKKFVLRGEVAMRLRFNENLGDGYMRAHYYYLRVMFVTFYHKKQIHIKYNNLLVEVLYPGSGRSGFVSSATYFRLGIVIYKF